MSIPNSYPFRFEFYYESLQDTVFATVDVVGQATFTLEIGAIVKFNYFSDGRDIMIPATAKSVIDVDRTLICTFIWVERMRVDSNYIVGMAKVDLLLNGTTGASEIKAGEFSWTFDATA